MLEKLLRANLYNALLMCAFCLYAQQTSLQKPSRRPIKEDCLGNICIDPGPTRGTVYAGVGKLTNWLRLEIYLQPYSFSLVNYNWSIYHFEKVFVVFQKVSVLKMVKLTFCRSSSPNSSFLGLQETRHAYLLMDVVTSPRLEIQSLIRRLETMTAEWKVRTYFIEKYRVVSVETISAEFVKCIAKDPPPLVSKRISRRWWPT